MAPPLSGSKIWAPNCRSASRASSAEVRIGNASSTITLVIRMFQVKIGIRNIVMPGARRVTTVVIMLTAPRMVPRPDMARPMIHRSPPTPGRVGGVAERGVGVPAEVGGAARSGEAAHHGEPAEQEQPVGQRVQPREAHVRGADLQRQHQVGEREQHGRREQQQHDRAVHGEQLVVLLQAEELQPGPGQLTAHQQRHHAAGQEERERGDQVHLADGLVIGRPQQVQED